MGQCKRCRHTTCSTKHTMPHSVSEAKNMKVRVVAGNKIELKCGWTTYNDGKKYCCKCRAFTME